MAMRIAQISVQNNTQMAEQITRPDICVDIPMDTFGLMDFEKGRKSLPTDAGQWSRHWKNGMIKEKVNGVFLVLMSHHGNVVINYRPADF